MIKGVLSFNPLESDAQYPDIVFFSVIIVMDKEIYLLHLLPPSPKEIYLLALNENRFGYMARPEYDSQRLNKLF